MNDNSYTLLARHFEAGKPPDVRFEYSDDLCSMRATPEGAVIVIERISPMESRIQLFDTMRGAKGKTVDMALLDYAGRDVPEWENPAAYAVEVACALYWSQWRSQQRCVAEGHANAR